MHSIPDPIPQSIRPALILEAMVAQDSKPEEQSLFTAMMGVVSGMPAMSWAILKWISPAPTIKLLPTQMSCTFLGQILALSTTPEKTAVSKVSGWVSLSPPLFALVKGVLTAEQITTSLGSLLDFPAIS